MAGVGELELEPELRDPVARRLRRARRGCSRGARDNVCATSRSRLERSSASTSIDTTNVAGWSWSHSTSMSRSACPTSPAAFAQSVRCTDTPRPRVTNPMISSPGTGVQHRDSRTMTSSRPSTCTPVARRSRRRGVSGGRDGGDGQLLLPAAQLAVEALHDALRRHVALADRGVERLEVGVVHRLGDARAASSTAASFCTGSPSLPQRLRELLAPGVDGVDAPLA